MNMFHNIVHVYLHDYANVPLYLHTLFNVYILYVHTYILNVSLYEYVCTCMCIHISAKADACIDP